MPTSPGTPTQAARATGGQRLYSLLLYLLAPLVFLRLAWRGRRNPAYWRRWPERLARLSAPALHDAIWVHAVSVGEVQAAVPLVKALRARYPQRSLVLTTTTPTGSQRVRELFGDDVFHVYVPYDLPGAVCRFLDRIRPRLALIMETELWPNLFRACAARGVPVVIANARLSPRSLRGYRRVAALVRTTLEHTAAVAAQSRLDARRFLDLGAPAERVYEVGNLKFEQAVPISVTEQAEVLRRQWGAQRPIWIAASTHEGEEEAVLDAFERVRGERPDVLLVLVPRHPERFARVAALCERRGLSVVRRSEQRPCTPQTQVFLGDTLGELALFYGAADVAFVGGSLVPVGGHNMLEPAAQGVPVLVGPHLFNFVEISDILLEAGAAAQVAGSAHLAEAVARLLADPVARAEMGERGRALVEANRGALQRLLDLITPYLDSDEG